MVRASRAAIIVPEGAGKEAGRLALQHFSRLELHILEALWTHVACSSRGGVQVWKATHITMQNAAGALGVVLRSPVVDQTGLDGFYEIDIELPALQPTSVGGGPDPTSASDAPSIFTVIREKIGLTLEPGKAPMEMLVIDRIELPTEN